MNQLLIDRVDKVGATLQQYSFSFRQKKVLEKDIAHNLHKIQVYPPPTLYKLPWCCLYRGPQQQKPKQHQYFIVLLIFS